MKAFLNENSILPCERTGSPIADKVHRHIVTGNSKVITNNKLHELFSKGPKYWENGTADYGKAVVWFQ